MSKDVVNSGKSGRLDLNQRPLRPERSALAKLSYAPTRMGPAKTNRAGDLPRRLIIIAYVWRDVNCADEQV